ncbi:hypothetical protein V7147_19210 [Bacillus sp. JJ1521]|uniref:hypothetical protein n=1 Tax=Bacillus sp. JJ1521 TaxID=3122957 RepID=UPI002FFEE223
MLLDFLLLDPELYTLMALNVSLCLGLMLTLLSAQRVEVGFDTPFSDITKIQKNESKSFDLNRSLLIQYFITRRIVKSIRNRVFTSDDADSLVSFNLNR